MKTILIAEDDQDIRSIVHDMLAGEGYTVISVEDGQYAKEFIEKKFLPDLLITDMMMPRMQGNDLVKLVKKDYPHANVIVYSASVQFKKEMESLGAHFVPKPFEMEQFISLVKATINKEDL